MTLDTPYVEYLYQALNTLEGLVLRSSDPAFVIRKLKEAKLLSLDDTLACLTIIPSPTSDGEIWIMKNEQPPT